MDKLTMTRASAMRDQISLKKAGLLDIPVISFNGNLMSQQSSRLSAAINATFEFSFLRFKSSVSKVEGLIERSFSSISEVIR